MRAAPNRTSGTLARNEWTKVPLVGNVPALYDCRVRHVRRTALHRAFESSLYLWLVDLDALPRLPRVLRPVARFDARDHVAGTAPTIRAGLERYLAANGIDLDGGRVLMLASARVLGYVFNPLTVFWCHRRDGSLACVVAEVHNTYGERHCYLVHTDEHGSTDVRADVDKDFYVSPFLTTDGHYRMVLPVPSDRLSIAVTLRQGGATALAATVTGTRLPATPARFARVLLRQPLITQRISAGIRRHGITLWLRRLPVVPRPQHTPQKGLS